MNKYGPGASRSSGMTVIDTKNRKYKILWGEEGIYSINDGPYCLGVFNKYLIILNNYIFNLEDVNFDCSCGVLSREEYIILKERFTNNFLQIEKDFKKISKIKIEGYFDDYSFSNTGLIKVTNEIICFFKATEIIF